ncbi:LysR family transcriptional regulator [Ideonella alba]|uniref:LysR family transcriptional regulator n=1 Tax=Ideonella alba TaxID=2824118 RepID=A0A940Y5V0_9BURK|nr:LysR family transcriptional regulator [Ideonella alba]MBQ0928855.1 LysR family transcriptional regulator [Ideonella alba]
MTSTDNAPRHPPWAHLHALTVLGEAGSFTAAAQRLGWSKALMSQRVAELEAQAGVPLVRRTTRSVRLTEAGQQLVDRSRGAFAEIDAALASVRDLAGAPRGLLRVTAPVALARQQLLPRLPDFLRRYPELRLELDLADRLASLAQEGFDLAIRHTHAPPDTHVAWPLCETRSVLVASPAYLRARGTPAHPLDLSAHDCLYYPRPGATPVWQLEARQGGARHRVAVRGPLAANNSEALREAALGDLGIALLPDFSAQAALQSGQLLPVLPAWRPVGAFAERLWAIRPHSAQVPRGVQVLVAWLREALAHGFGPAALSPSGAPRAKKTT